MPNDKFYALTNWRNLRALKLQMNPICENEKCINIATEVHHVKEKNKYPDLALSVDNLQSLCKSCHSSITVKNIKRVFNVYNLKHS